LRILHLEDSEPDLNLVRQYMKSTAHQFVGVRTVAEAQQYLQGEQADVFLIDIVIQGRPAYDLITFASEQQRARYIIALTAKALPSERRRYLDMGCTRVIPKPFTIDDLERALEQLA
jgi:DNA-binding response OmpR family regulator